MKISAAAPLEPEPLKPVLHGKTERMGDREVPTRLSGAEHRREVGRLLGLLDRLHSNVRLVESTFRFAVIVADPEDNKFRDCAVAAGAGYVVTDDAHFAVLQSAGCNPKPQAPDKFIQGRWGRS